MMFDEFTKNQIVKGKKVVTRRIRRNNNPPAKIGACHKLKIDRTQKTYGYIQIVNVRSSMLGELTLIDAIKEGFASKKDYLQYFLEVNGTTNPYTPIWVIDFKYYKRRN